RRSAGMPDPCRAGVAADGSGRRRSEQLIPSWLLGKQGALGMYRQILLAGALAVAATAAPAATPWTHCFAEGEDASSRHYYFFLDPGSGVERVRWVWNGGCCNPPEVTEFN